MSQPQRQFRWPTEPKLAKPPKAEPESWTIQFTTTGSSDIPPVCRIRKILKNAWRCYNMKAKIVAGPPAPTGQGIAQPPAIASVDTESTIGTVAGTDAANGHSFEGVIHEHAK